MVSSRASSCICRCAASESTQNPGAELAACSFSRAARRLATSKMPPQLVYSFGELFGFFQVVGKHRCSGVRVFRRSGVQVFRADKGKPVFDLAGPEHLNT